MPRYLIDANLPYYFSLWEGKEFVHQADLGVAGVMLKSGIMPKSII